jgi:hypothetical protein
MQILGLKKYGILNFNCRDAIICHVVAEINFVTNVEENMEIVSVLNRTDKGKLNYQ